MSRVIAALRENARATPTRIAVDDGRAAMSYGQLARAVDQAAGQLRKSVPHGRRLGLLADNSCAWVIADLAALAAGIAIVPLPTFFSAAQIAHALRQADVGYLLLDDPRRSAGILPPDSCEARASIEHLAGIELPAVAAAAVVPAGTWKITFTSGTTGEPKGVCLGANELETTAQSLLDASGCGADDRHLCLLPLATLLENIGGVYAPILAGATVLAPSLARLGFSGSSSLDVSGFIGALHAWQPTSLIAVPQLLQVLVRAAQGGVALPHSLRHVAVGGAPLTLRMLHQARAVGLPVYEGYGLSECASVVAVNRPDAARPGSVGKPLPHIRIAFAEDGEILVGGAAMRGYLGEPARPDDSIATGDLGHLDSDGFLHLTGRKKNLFVTAFGRNVAPEWVECELAARPPIAQAAVFGEARPFNTAVIVAQPSASDQAIDAAIADANRHLPDYARVQAWIPATAMFSADNGLATANGRLRRMEIFARYAERIEAIYLHQERTGTQ